MKIFDEVSKFWLPWNPITREIKHDMRFIISMPQKQPWVYQISKVNNVDNKGIIEFTLKQTEFNQFTDYVDLDPNNIQMYADYYKSNITPEDNEKPVPKNTNTLEITSGNYSITLGYKKTVKVVMKDVSGEVVKDIDTSKYSWEIGRELSDRTIERIDDKENIVTLLTPLNSDTLSFKIVNESEYNKNTINITCKYNDGSNVIVTSRTFTTKR